MEYRGREVRHSSALDNVCYKVADEYREARDVSQLAVEGLYREYGAELAASLLLSLEDSHAAEALAHETFLRAVSEEASLRSHPDPRAWLYRTAYRLARGRRAGFGLRPQLTVAEEHPILAPKGIALSAGLLQALHDLSPLDRDATVLHELAGFEIGETAELLGRATGSIETASRRGRDALEAMPAHREAYQQLVATVHPIHEERLEDLSYADVGERSFTAYFVGIAAVLMLLGWGALRLLDGSDAPPPQATGSLAAPAPTATPTASTGAVRATEVPVAGESSDLDTGRDTSCTNASALSETIARPLVGKSAGWVLHIRATHLWETPKGKKINSQQTELWLDPGNGDSRYVTRDTQPPFETVYVRGGNLYSLSVPSQKNTATWSLPDTSDPYAGPPQGYVYRYKRYMERMQTAVKDEETVDGRRAAVLFVGGRQYGQRILKVWVDRQDGKLLREFHYWVNADDVPVLQVRHYIRYTLLERVPRDRLAADLFDLPQARSEPVRRTPENDEDDDADAASPLAIPAGRLERLGLECTRSWTQGVDLTTLLERHKGQRVLSNVWTPPGREGATSVLGVLDERYSFPSPEAAESFLQGGILNEFSIGMVEDRSKLQIVRLGRLTVAYKALSLGNRDSPMQRVYVFAFRVGNVVSRLGVAGKHDLSREQAFELLRAALDQMSRPSDRSAGSPPGRAITPWPTPTPKAGGAYDVASQGIIAYTYSYNGRHGVYGMYPDGSNRVRLTRTSLTSQPNGLVWTPDGRAIGFNVERKTQTRTSLASYFTRTDGSGMVPAGIPARKGGYAWSPDGRHVAFAESGEIWVSNMAGEQRRRLTQDRVEDSDPSWSPDGSRVVFASCEQQCQSRHRLRIVGTDGGRPVDLTTTSQLPPSPAWSPDGKRIAFVVTDGAGRGALQLIGPDGAGRRQLMSERGASYLNPTWSPDGKRLAYRAAGIAPPGIWVVNADGSGQDRIVGAGPGVLGEISWSPAGVTLPEAQEYTGRGPVPVGVRSTSLAPRR